MKINKISLLALAAVGMAACNDVNNLDPQGTGLTSEQLVESSEMVETRADAEFAGMFTMMGQPYYTFGEDRGRADDFGFIMTAISTSAESGDLIYPNSGYNWFSACGELSSRNPDYANPYIRYSTPYNQIQVANSIISKYKDSQKESDQNHVAQARAIRAFDYLALAPYFQFGYAAGAQDKPCVPIVTEETTEFSNNPRATVAEVYAQIEKDLNDALAVLTTERSDKSRINKTVVLGLLARTALAKQEWAKAADYADQAIKSAQSEGIRIATIQEVSTPAFCNINEPNWIWGYDMTTSMSNEEYATSPSWLGSFSAAAYAAGVQCYAMINHLLWNKISATDIRKQWWVDEKLHSDLLSTVSWSGVSGDAISKLAIDDVKMEFLPYTNVKFGIPSGIGSTANDSDFPFMRIEEMYLIKAEGQAKSGDVAGAQATLREFAVNRDPAYVIPTAATRSLEDEIWFQRRVELWGEGFAWSDLMRLNKPMVRFHEGDDAGELPEDFRFNMPAGDGWMLMRFPTDEMNTNKGIVDNEDGFQPVKDQNPELRDGVTD